MNQMMLRTAAIILHAVANFIVVSVLLNYDISGSWVVFLGFVAVVLVLVYLFIRHLLSYIYYIKTKNR